MPRSDAPQGDASHSDAPRSHAAVPKVRVRALRDLGPKPSLDAEAPLPKAADALLAARAAIARARAEEKSLSPPYLEAVDRRIALERRIEENLARGRAVTRHEIRRATDPARAGREAAHARFPRAFNPLLWMIEGAALGFGAVLAPFLAYFALIALILI